MLRHLLVFCLGFVFSFCAPRDCTPAEAAAISCSGTQYSCYIDAEEYQDGSSKNIPHCIKTFQKTWTVDTVNRGYDHYHVYVSGSTPLPLTTVLDDKTPKLKQRVINGNLNTRVNGDMATIGATVMIPKYNGYNFVPTSSDVYKMTVTADRRFLNDGNFAQSNYTLCQSDYVYNPSNISYCKNSSSSTFDFSDKGTFIQGHLKGENVVYARLYWGGSIYQNWKVQSGPNFVKTALEYMKGYSKIDFKAPGKPVVTLDADPKDVFWIGSFSEYRPKSMTIEAYNQSGDHQTPAKAGINYVYAASADVTDIVKDTLGTTSQDRTFYAGNIRATTIPTKPDFIDPSDAYFTKPGGVNVALAPVWGTLLFGPATNSNVYDNGYWLQTIGGQYAAWSLVIIYDFDDETAITNNIEPKLVSIFDGLEKLAPDLIRINEAPGTIKSSTIETTFDNIYTPKTGNMDAALTVLSFGGKKEVKGENIQIKKGANYESITSANNAQGEQFNSTMTKFGQNINPGRDFNTQVDLDIFDISSNIEPNKTKAEIKMKFTVSTKKDASSSIVSADRVNLAMVGFSTRIYRPGACYMEYIYKKEPGQSNFTLVAKNTPISVPRNTILKTVIQAVNNTNEDADEFALKTTINPSQTYKPNSTKIISSTTISSYSETMIGQQDYNDNTGLQQLSGNTLTFYLGENANTNIGGKLKHNKGNYAYAIYEAALKSKFEQNSYKATIVNSSINLASYDTYINKCSDYYYDISVDPLRPNDFIPSNKQDDGSPTFKNKYKNRLLTQIVTKPFNLYITNYGPDGNKRIPDTPVDVKVEVVTSCAAPATDQDQVLLTENIRFDGVSEILIPNIKIDKAYKSVRLRISHFDPSSNTNKVACQDLDDFAVRPHHFRLWNTDSNTKRTGSFTLVGGEVYNNIAIAAMKPDDTHIARGYTHNIDGTNGEIALKPASTATCDPSFLASENKLSVNFSDGIGQISRHTSSGSVISGFSYSDIGDTSFYILDKSHTSTDQHTSPREDDCVRGSTSNDPTQDPEGRVGCNIKIEDVEDYLFKPKEIQISNLKIEKDDEVTYLDSEGVQKAKLTFDVVAKLGNNQAARLYKDGCYARATSFDIKLDRVPLNFTDNNGNAGTLAKANEELLFFEIPSSNTKKVTGPGVSKNRFYVGISTFVNGKAKGEVNFNFTRKINHAKNPFTVSSNDFAFSSIEDSSTISKIYTKSPNETTAKFYYGRVYAPFYEGLYSGFNAKIYYGAYCDGCNKNIYMKDSSGAFWKDFPAAIFWSTNPNHSAGALGFNDFSFTNTYSMTVLRNNVSAINNGEQIIFVSNPSAVTDVAKMKAPKWLLYNEFDENAITNNFNLNFLVPNGDWAGKTLNKDNTKSNEGSFIGKINNSNSQLDVVDKTNRRIEW